MRIALGIAGAAAGAFLTFSVNAQQSLAENICARAPAEKKAACIKFVETCRWDEGKGGYVNRSDGKACGSTPAGVPSREQIRAERDKFLANNKWDEAKGMWVPLSQSRPVDTKRADVKADAQAFGKTHKWDEGKGMYVPVK